MTGREERPKDLPPAPAGWSWAGTAFEVDTKRAVDADGWEYATDFSGSFHPMPRRLDFVRRRRLTCERFVDTSAATSAATASPTKKGPKGATVTSAGARAAGTKPPTHEGRRPCA